MSEAVKVTWQTGASSTVSWWGRTWELPSRTGQVQRIGTGLVAERINQDDYVSAIFGPFNGGLVPRQTFIESWLRGTNVYVRNEGLQTRGDYGPALPYVKSHQASMTSDIDLSSAIAANTRCHDALSAVGSSVGLLLYKGVGTVLLRKASGSDDLEVAHTFTDKILWCGDLIVNNARVFAVMTNGATNDICYTTNPTATPIVFSTLVALSAGDYPFAGSIHGTTGTPFNAVVGRVGGTDGVWYALGTETAAWTLKPVVKAESKDLPGTATPVTASAIYATSMIPSSTLAVTVTDPTNVGADDGNEATYDYGTVTSQASLRAVGFKAPSGVARSAKLTGFVIETQAAESNADDNIRLSTVQVYLNGSSHGSALPLSNFGGEVTTTPTTYSLGTSTNDLGLGMTIGDLDNLTLDFAISMAGSTCIFEVDFVRVTPTYRVTGTQFGFARGGFGFGKSRFDDDRLGINVPTADDPTGIMVPREPYFLDFEWDASGARPVVDLFKPDIGMKYCHAICWYGGNVLSVGSDTSGPGIRVKYTNPQNQVIDFSFPGVHGTQEVVVNNILTRDSWPVLQVLDDDYGDLQEWFYQAQRWYPDTILQSKSGQAIAAQAIPCSVWEVDPQDNLLYDIYPNGTDIGVSYQFLPPDLGQNPHLVNTDKLKTMGWSDSTEQDELYLYMPTIDLGHLEAFRGITELQMHTFKVSGNTSNDSYGSVTVDMVTDKADITAFASAEYTKEFTAGFDDASDGHVDQPAGGIPYAHVSTRFGLKHEAGTAKTPELGPVLVVTAQTFGSEQDHLILVDSEQTFRTREEWDLQEEFRAAQEVNPIGTLTVGHGKYTPRTVFKGLRTVGDILGASGLPLSSTLPEGVSINQYVAVFSAVKGKKAA